MSVVAGCLYKNKVRLCGDLQSRSFVTRVFEVS